MVTTSLTNPIHPNLKGKVSNKMSGMIDKAKSTAQTKKFQPPIQLYKAAAIASLLTASALEGAGLALQQAIKDRSLTEEEAKNVVTQMVQRGGAGSMMPNTPTTMATSSPLNLPPGVQDTTNLILDVAGKTKNVVLDGIDIASKKSYEVGSRLLTNALDAVVPVDLLNKSYSDINPKLTNQLSALASNFEQMAQDPQARQAIANLAKAMADVGIDAINAAKPQIDKLVNRIWEVANNVGSKSIRSAMNVGLAMLITALAEVPVVGGVVVGSLEAGSIFNNVVETGAKAIQGFSQIANDSMDAISTVASTVGQSEGKIKAPLEQVKQVYNKFGSSNIGQRLQSAQQSAQQGFSKFKTQGQTALNAASRPITVGGMRKKTRRIETRIHKTIKNFLKN